MSEVRLGRIAAPGDSDRTAAEWPPTMTAAAPPETEAEWPPEANADIPPETEAEPGKPVCLMTLDELDE